MESEQLEPTPEQQEMPTSPKRHKPLWQIAQELSDAIPEEVWETWPYNPEGIDLETADIQDPHTRKKLFDELGRRMSHLSEMAYRSGWSGDLEERLPVLCEQAVNTGKPQRFGMTTLYPDLAARLLAMRDTLGHWPVPLIEGGYGPKPVIVP